MNYYEHHLGDYDGATAHLSWLEDCAYRRLICLYYRNEQPITSDLRQACRLVRATSKQEREAVEQVLAEFFTLIDGAWHHKRCDADLSRYQAKSQKARESVSKRWAKRDADDMPTNNEGNTNVSPEEYERNTDALRRQYTAHPSPDTRHQTPVNYVLPDGNTPFSFATSPQSAEPPQQPPLVDLAPPPPTAPPPPFGGDNAEVLNGKAIVTLAAAWELPEEWGLDAERLGWKPAEVIRQSERFRQYWTQGRGQGTRRSVKGWRQTWSNWLEKAAKDAR